MSLRRAIFWVHLAVGVTAAGVVFARHGVGDEEPTEEDRPASARLGAETAGVASAPYCWPSESVA